MGGRGGAEGGDKDTTRQKPASDCRRQKKQRGPLSFLSFGPQGREAFLLVLIFDGRRNF